MKNTLTAKRVSVFAVIAALVFACALCLCACGGKTPEEQDGNAVTSIAVTKQPNKLEYEVGDKFSRSGMRVTAYFADGTEKTILGYKIDKDGPLTLEDTVITITYQDCSTTVDITVKEKVIATQLSITSADFYTYKVEAEDCVLGSESAGVERSEYFEYHDDNTNNPETSGGISLGNLNYTNNTISLKIASSVEANFNLIASLSYNPSIEFDDNNELLWNGEKRETGWTVACRQGAEYSWFDWQEFTLKGLKLDIGINELVIKINSLSCNYDYFKIVVSPIDSEPVSIAVTTPPVKTEYIEGERFDPTGMVVTATYENGQEAPINDYTYYANPLQLGNTAVGIYFYELVTEVPVTVVERDMTLVSIAIDLAPYTKYNVGDYFHTDGMAVIATYADGFREYVSGWTVDKTEQLTADDTTVTVTYEGLTTTLDITIEPSEAHATVTNATDRLRVEAENAKIVYNKSGDTHGVEDNDATSGGLSIGNMRGTTASVKFYIDSEIDTVSDIVFRLAHPWMPFNDQAALYINGVRDDSVTLPWMITGAWFDWKEFTVSNVALKNGRNVVEILMLGGNREDGGFQIDCMNVVVNPLRSLAVTNAPAKTEYILGESFESIGMVITATYADGVTAKIDDYTVSPNGPLALTDKFVTVSYNGVSVDVEITVSAAAELSRIEVIEQPSKTNYRDGEYFEPHGMIVKAFYSDGSSSEISDYVIATPYAEAGKPVVISYNGKTAEIAVTVTSPEKTHISADKHNSVYVLEFEDADYVGSGYVLADSTGNNPNASGGKWLDGFDGKPASQFTVVINSDVEGTAAVYLSIASGKTDVLDEMYDFAWNGRDFESNVILPTLTWYPNGASSYVTSDVLGSLALHKGYNYFVIDIKSGSNVNMDCVKFEIASDEIVTLQSIEVTVPPTKIEYTQGESFDSSGMTVTAHYSDGSTKTVTDYAVTPDRVLTKDDTAVIVSYGGFTAAVEITVAAPAALKEIKVTVMPDKTAYLAGELFDVAGMTVKAVFDDDSEIIITNYTHKEYVDADDTFITLSYDGKTVNVPITVTVPQSAHITVTTDGMAENNGVYVLEFEDADYTPGANDSKTELVLGENESSSGGKFLDSMDFREGTTFEIRIYSEVESTAWILFSIAAPAASLDSQWTFEWNGKIVLTDIPATTHGWFPGTSTEVSSDALGALQLREGWNYVKITLKQGSNVNMDYIKIAVAPVSETTDVDFENIAQEAILTDTENKGDQA